MEQEYKWYVVFQYQEGVFTRIRSGTFHNRTPRLDNAEIDKFVN